MIEKVSIFRSVRFRLTSLYAGILGVSFLVTGVYVLYAVQDAAQETVDNELHARLTALRDSISTAKRVENEDDLREIVEDGSASGPAGVWVQIADAQGHLLYRSTAMTTLSVVGAKAANLPVRGRIQNARIRGKKARVLSAPLLDNTVQIAMPMGEFEEMWQELVWTLGLATPIMLLLAGVSGYWLSGRALKPVDEMGRTVQRINSDNLTERLTLRGTGDELDRLAEVTNQMLCRLESAFSLVTQLTADVSHELRTPVAIIRTTGEVVRSARRTPDEHEIAWDRVIVQTERMSGLIDDLLLLARSDAGRSELQFDAVDVAQILRSTVKELEEVARKSELALSISIPQSCPMQADEAGLRRLFLILLDNGIKYTGTGGSVFVTLRLLATSAVIEVQDTGVGIGPDDLPHIFDRFYRVSTDRSRQSGGAGLGLSIAQWLVSQHGGEITCESTLGVGSTFRVALPRPHSTNHCI